MPLVLRSCARPHCLGPERSKQMYRFGIHLWQEESRTGTFPPARCVSEVRFLADIIFAELKIAQGRGKSKSLVDF